MQQPSGHKCSEHGFTLIELVVVMTIIGILAALGGIFIVRPIEGFLDLSRRATLVDAAENALRRMQRDIRRALPNSVRIAGGGTCLELLLTDDGGRYRSKLKPDGSGDVLDFIHAADNTFDVLGSLSNAPTAGDALVIYNLTTAPDNMCNAYEDEDNNRRTVVGGNVNSIQFAPTTKPFPFTSPYQRFFLVDGPVSYVCDTTAGTLTRHDGYAISAGQSTTPGGSAAVMARYVSACSFIYQPGTSQRAGLVTLQLQLSDQGETVTLLHQVHVENAP